MLGFSPLETRVGWRYIRRGRRDGFLSFIAGMSVVSIALGVAALIIVLSVMNGFQKEVRDRMLGVVPHVELYSLTGEAVDTDRYGPLVAQDPEVLGVAPFVDGQALVSRGRQLRGVAIKGIEPSQEPKVSALADEVTPKNSLGLLTPGSFNLIVGKDLAFMLGLHVGDKMTVMVPSGSVTPAGFVPRMKSFDVVGIMDSGHYQYDSAVVLMNLEDAASLLKRPSPMGLRLKLRDMNKAPEVASRLMQTYPHAFLAQDWTQQNAAWFAAVKVEKHMMSVILFLIVVVGAFGLVNALVMTVNEKRSDIAILRTLGASQGMILRLFLLQGAVIGAVGVVLGVFFGVLIAYNVGAIVEGIEALFHVTLVPKQVYFISTLPSDVQLSDIIPIALSSFVLSMLVTLYPSWRAASTHPAEALRYE